LSLRSQHDFWLAGVNDDRWSRVLPLHRWWVGVCQCLGIKPKVVDGVNVEQLVLTSTGPDLLSTPSAVMLPRSAWAALWWHS
jgi:hypothetical protein